jgi:hypothetical protein
VFADPFYQYSEDKFANSLKGYLKDIGAVLELYRASQVIIHPDESVLVKQSSWTRNLLKHDSSPYQLYADKLRIYVDNEVVYYLNFSLNLTTYRQPVLVNGGHGVVGFLQQPLTICKGMSAIAAAILSQAAMSCLYGVFLAYHYMPQYFIPS